MDEKTMNQNPNELQNSNDSIPAFVWMNLYKEARRYLIMIADLAEDYDEDGATGPKKPYSWETVGRIAIDYARSGLSKTDPSLTPNP